MSDNGCVRLRGSCSGSARVTFSLCSFLLYSLQPSHNTVPSLKELLMICLAIRYFQHLLEGWPFTIFTDHKPLTMAMNNSSDKYTSREIRHLDYISQLITDLHNIKGENNALANTLSQTGINTLNVDTLSQDLIVKIRLHPMRCSSRHFLGAFLKFPAPFSDKMLYCDVKLCFPRPYISPILRKLVFRHLHRLSHPSKQAAVKFLIDCLWPNMNSNIDWGAQFQSSLFSEFTLLLVVKHICMTAYNLYANGLVERFHQSLKTSLATRHNTSNCDEDLPLIHTVIPIKINDILQLYIRKT